MFMKWYLKVATTVLDISAMAFIPCSKDEDKNQLPTNPLLIQGFVGNRSFYYPAITLI
jgi:hypothetical protein